MTTLLFILICYGACNNMIYGSIFEGWRNFLSKFGKGGYSLYKLFNCFMCLGTWMGFAITVIMRFFDYTKFTPMGSLGVENIYLIIFFNGLIASAGVWLIHTLQEALERAFTSNQE
jgi:hypothetical protein